MIPTPERAVPALKFRLPLPDHGPDIATETRAQAIDFHGVAFYKPHCETRPVTAGGLARSDHDLVVRLGRMPVDLAAPLLRSSLPSLDAAALLALIATTGEAHHVLIAQRSGLDWRVVRALIRGGHDAVLIALVNNTGIDIDPDDRIRLERLATERTELRAALSQRYGMPRDLVAHDDSHSNLKLLKLMRGQESTKFCQESAKRLQISAQNLHQILQKTSAVPLALTVCALGLDRAVFLYFLPFWQAANAGLPQFREHHRPLILSVFALTPAAARDKLLALLNP